MQNCILLLIIVMGVGKYRQELGMLLFTYIFNVDNSHQDPYPKLPLLGSLVVLSFLPIPRFLIPVFLPILILNGHICHHHR